MMMKSETQVAQGELQMDGEKLAALISLTPEQLETVAAGFSISEAIFGFIASVRQLLNR